MTWVCLHGQEKKEGYYGYQKYFYGACYSVSMSYAGFSLLGY